MSEDGASFIKQFVAYRHMVHRSSFVFLPQIVQMLRQSKFDSLDTAQILPLPDVWKVLFLYVSFINVRILKKMLCNLF